MDSLATRLREHPTPIETHHNAKPDPDRCVRCEAADRLDALESLCADKTAGIENLIEQLQKAEARNAELEPLAGLGAVHMIPMPPDRRSAVEGER